MRRLAALVLTIACVTGCSKLPYRIEFGRKKKTAPTAGAEPTPAQPRPQLTANQAWLAWQSLHKDLERVYRTRRGVRGPVPTTRYERCRRAVQQMNELLEVELDEHLARYDDIEEDTGATNVIILRKLERLAIDLRAAVFHRGDAEES